MVIKLFVSRWIGKAMIKMCIHARRHVLKKYCTNLDSRREVFCKNVFLENSQNSQENTCVAASFSINLPTKLLRTSSLKLTIKNLFKFRDRSDEGEQKIRKR